MNKSQHFYRNEEVQMSTVQALSHFDRYETHLSDRIHLHHVPHPVYKCAVLQISFQPEWFLPLIARAKNATLSMKLSCRCKLLQLKCSNAKITEDKYWVGTSWDPKVVRMALLSYFFHVTSEMVVEYYTGLPFGFRNVILIMITRPCVQKPSFFQQECFNSGERLIPFFCKISKRLYYRQK